MQKYKILFTYLVCFFGIQSISPVFGAASDTDPRLVTVKGEKCHFECCQKPPKEGPAEGNIRGISSLELGALNFDKEHAVLKGPVLRATADAFARLKPPARSGAADQGEASGLKALPNFATSGLTAVYLDENGMVQTYTSFLKKKHVLSFLKKGLPKSVQDEVVNILSGGYEASEDEVFPFVSGPKDKLTDLNIKPASKDVKDALEDALSSIASSQQKFYQDYFANSTPHMQVKYTPLHPYDSERPPFALWQHPNIVDVIVADILAHMPAGARLLSTLGQLNTFRDPCRSCLTYFYEQVAHFNKACDPKTGAFVQINRGLLSKIPHERNFYSSFIASSSWRYSQDARTASAESHAYSFGKLDTFGVHQYCYPACELAGKLREMKTGGALRLADVLDLEYPHTFDDRTQTGFETLSSSDQKWVLAHKKPMEVVAASAYEFPEEKENLSPLKEVLMTPQRGPQRKCLTAVRGINFHSGEDLSSSILSPFASPGSMLSRSPRSMSPVSEDLCASPVFFSLLASPDSSRAPSPRSSSPSVRPSSPILTLKQFMDLLDEMTPPVSCAIDISDDEDPQVTPLSFPVAAGAREAIQNHIHLHLPRS